MNAPFLAAGRVLCPLVLSWMVLALEAGAAERADRARSLELLCERLGIGAGAVAADIGCGRGHDSFIFAEVVGADGTVLAEEIDPTRLQDVINGSRERDLKQVVPVLGEPSDPRLPNGRVDLVYMHLVFHHFTEPQAMLASLLRDLRPGGYLAIADRQRGPLTDWVPMERRGREHHWTGETFVVRLALEAGFVFDRLLDDIWFEKDAFVLVFRRPEADAASTPSGPLQLDGVARAAGLSHEPKGSTVLFALEAGRGIVPLAREAHDGSAWIFDVVLEEWITAPEEAPEHGAIDGVEVLRTSKGALPLPEDVSVERAVFVDSYHRIWDPAEILGRLRRAMPAGSRLVVVDRRGPDGEERRVAGHRRRISPASVRDELNRAGFRLVEELAPPTPDRFVLIFAPGPWPEGALEGMF